jgi:hypothetical protein
VRAAELKAPGLDWTEVLAVEPDNPRGRLAAELMANAAHSRPIKQSGIAGELARRRFNHERRAEEG